MGMFSGLLGHLGMNSNNLTSVVGIINSNTTAVPSQHLQNSSATLTQAQYNAMIQQQVLQMRGSQMGAFSPIVETYRIDQDVNTLRRMAELNGDKVIDVRLMDAELYEKYKADPRIVMLKAAGQGKYVKNIGIMVDEYYFILYEEVD